MPETLSTSTLPVQSWRLLYRRLFLFRKVFLSLPNILSLPVLQEFESNINETCWLICKKDYTSKCQVLPEDCMYKLFRVFCFLSELVVDPERPNRFQVITFVPLERRSGVTSVVRTAFTCMSNARRSSWTRPKWAWWLRKLSPRWEPTGTNPVSNSSSGTPTGFNLARF